MKTSLVLILSSLLLVGCSHQPHKLSYDDRIETAIKLCQSESTKAYSHTDDGLRITCDNGSSYIIRGGISIDDIVGYDEGYCLNMGITTFESSNDGVINLTCKDKNRYTIRN